LIEVLDFKNKNVLDVGCRDGFFSYLMEKKRNIVTSIDACDSLARRFTHSYLGSKSEFHHINVNQLHTWDKKFDIILVGDILLHLENPLGILKILRNMTTERIIVISDYFDSSAPLIQIQNVDHTPYKFSIPALATMLELSGFKGIAVEKFLKIKCESSIYNFGERNICIITANINKRYVFNKFYSGYYTQLA
jgi:hypothetical protein